MEGIEWMAGIVLLLGWLALPAIWWFGFRGRGEEHEVEPPA